MNVLGHLILRLICLGPAFNLAGAPTFPPPLREGWDGLDVAFRLNTPSPKRPVYANAQKLVARPVEFSLPMCHATNGDFSNRSRDKTCEGPASFRGQLASPLKSAGGEEKANRNTCQIRNRYNPLTTKHITFSNRNKNHVSAKSPTFKSSAARFPVAPGTSPSCPCTRLRTAHPTRRKPPAPILRSHKSSPAAAWCC